MKRFFSILIAIPLIALCFSSCDSNDNDSNVPEQSLVSGTEFVGSTTITIDSSVSTKADSDNAYVQDPATYKVDLTDETLTLTLEKAQMSSAMPVQVDIVIPGISYTMKDENYTFSGDNIVPTYLGKPFAQYAISSLSGNIKLMDDNTFQLTVNMIMGSYDVFILANSVN